jgi:hypothetical protein
MRHISSFPAIKFAQSARKHRIGKANALHVMASATPVVTAATGDVRETWSWVGRDARGLELEVVARVLDTDSLLVIHVMPYAFRRNR